MTKIIKVLLLSLQFALVACTDKQATQAWIRSATGIHMEDMIKTINESNVRRVKQNYPIIEYEIIKNDYGKRIFIQTFDTNNCLLFWDVDELNTLRNHRFEGDC